MYKIPLPISKRLVLLLIILWSLRWSGASTEISVNAIVLLYTILLLVTVVKHVTFASVVIDVHAIKLLSCILYLVPHVAHVAFATTVSMSTPSNTSIPYHWLSRALSTFLLCSSISMNITPLAISVPIVKLVFILWSLSWPLSAISISVNSIVLLYTILLLVTLVKHVAFASVFIGAHAVVTLARIILLVTFVKHVAFASIDINIYSV